MIHKPPCDEVDGVRQLAEQNFPGPEGRPFTLGVVAEVTRSVQQVQIVRSEKRRSTIVYANNAPGHGMGEVVDRALARAKEELPRGYSAALGGQSEYMDEAFTEFGLVTVIAIALTYLLLAANSASRWASAQSAAS